MLMVTMPLGGITGGTQSILGFNYGARRPDRVLKAQKYIILLCVSFTALLFLFAQLAPHLFVLIFTREPEYVALASRAIRIYTLGIIPLGIQYEIVDGFTGMGVVQAALPLSFWRKLIDPGGRQPAPGPWVGGGAALRVSRCGSSSQSPLCSLLPTGKSSLRSSPRQAPPLRGGCAPKRACGRNLAHPLPTKPCGFAGTLLVRSLRRRVYPPRFLPFRLRMFLTEKQGSLTI